MLWACLHFPLLPVEALSQGAADAAPFAVASAETRPRVIALNPAAERAGLRPGMTVSAALARAPGLIARPRDGLQEAQTLQQVAQWALQFAPAPSLAGTDAVLLEIGAGLKLWGGLPALQARLRAQLATLGLSSVVAIAPTPTAALMLAHAGAARTVTDPALLAEALAPLPVAALGCAQDILATLADLGLHTLGALLALPRDGLARRFGQALIDTLDRALGRLPDPREPAVLPAQFSARLELPAPAYEVEAMLFGAKRLATTLAGWLRGRGLGVMRLRFDMLHADSPTSRVGLQLATPSRDPVHLSTLLRERLDRTRLPDRVEAIVLTAQENATLAGRDLGLFPGPEAGEKTELIERLAARLGDDAVRTLRPHADHRPELAWRSARPAQAVPMLLPPGPRPLWLLAQPQPLTQFLRAACLPLTLVDGPERIESGWWETRATRRDYFVAQARDGQRLWVYRLRPWPHGGLDSGSGAGNDCGDAWYVHGIFA